MKNKIRQSFLLLFLFLIFTKISFSQEEIPKVRNSALSLQDTTLAKEYLDKGKTLFETQYDSSYFYYGKAKEIYEELSKQYDQENIWVNLLCAQICSVGF